MNVIIHMNDYTRTYSILGEWVASGDIVGRIDGKGMFHVDQTDSWLFPWEKNDPDCYARRKQKEGVIKLGECL